MRGVNTSKTINVLFLGRTNSLDSLIAECLLSRHGMGRFKARSAAQTPENDPDPLVLDELARQNYNVAELRSKSWDEFLKEGAEKLDFVFTTNENLEEQPAWPGNPMVAHWAVEDPDQFDGPENPFERFRVDPDPVVRDSLQAEQQGSGQQRGNDHGFRSGCV